MNETKIPTDDMIAQTAHQLWQQAGQPANRDWEFWFQAEAQLREAMRLAPANRPRAGNSAGRYDSAKAKKKTAPSAASPHDSAGSPIHPSISRTISPALVIRG